MQPTFHQLGLMQQALGIAKKPYAKPRQNYFAASDIHEEWGDLQELVKGGYMNVEAPGQHSPCHVFTVTDKGMYLIGLMRGPRHAEVYKNTIRR